MQNNLQNNQKDKHNVGAILCADYEPIALPLAESARTLHTTSSPTNTNKKKQPINPKHPAELRIPNPGNRLRIRRQARPKRLDNDIELRLPSSHDFVLDRIRRDGEGGGEGAEGVAEIAGRGQCEGKDHRGYVERGQDVEDAGGEEEDQEGCAEHLLFFGGWEVCFALGKVVVRVGGKEVDSCDGRNALSERLMFWQTKSWAGDKECSGRFGFFFVGRKVRTTIMMSLRSNEQSTYSGNLRTVLPFSL